MRTETMRKMAIMATVGWGILGTGASQVEAQLFRRRRVAVQETIVVAPPPPVVVSTDRVKVRPGKVVVLKKRGVIARFLAVVTIPADSVICVPPAVEERLIPQPPVGEERVVHPPPLDDEPVLQPDPALEEKVPSVPR